MTGSQRSPTFFCPFGLLTQKTENPKTGSLQIALVVFIFVCIFWSSSSKCIDQRNVVSVVMSGRPHLTVVEVVGRGLGRRSVTKAFEKRLFSARSCVFFIHLAVCFCKCVVSVFAVSLENSASCQQYALANKYFYIFRETRVLFLDFGRLTAPLRATWGLRAQHW